MSDDHQTKTELLSAMGWDLRALGESQLRSLTAMQRCIDDFRKTGDADALDGVRRHVGELQQRSPQVQESLRLLLEVVSDLDGVDR